MNGEREAAPPAVRWWSKDTVAVVTGGNKGIGFSLARRLAILGVTVVLTARDEFKGRMAVDQLKQEDGLLLHFYPLDVLDHDSIQAFAWWFGQELGVLDILVNNAGVSFKEINDNSVENAETVIQTNFYGAKRLTEALLPMFRRSNSVSRILNISSRLGSINKMRNLEIKKILESETLSETHIDEITNRFLKQVKEQTWTSQGWPLVWTDYAVSKMALNAYTRILAKRYKDDNLSVNCYCPGFTRTTMTGGEGNHSADDAAQIAASFLLLPPQDMPTGKFLIGPTQNGTRISRL